MSQYPPRSGKNFLVAVHSSQMASSRRSFHLLGVVLVRLDVFCAGPSCCRFGEGGGGILAAPATAGVTPFFSFATAVPLRTTLFDVAGTFGVSCFALFVDRDGERVRRWRGEGFECTPDAFDTDPDLDRNLDRDRDLDRDRKLDRGSRSGDGDSSYLLDLTLQSETAFNGNGERSDAFSSCRGRLLVLPSGL